MSEDMRKIKPEKSCVECLQVIEDYAGNPSLWGTFIADKVNKGKIANYHVGCLTEKVASLEAALEHMTAMRENREKEVCEQYEKIQKLEKELEFLKTENQSDKILLNAVSRNTEKAVLAEREEAAKIAENYYEAHCCEDCPCDYWRQDTAHAIRTRSEHGKGETHEV